jgi:hypothetical protein
VKRPLLAAVAFASVALACGSARAGSFVEATTSGNATTSSTIGTLDLTTGQFVARSTLTVVVGSLTAAPSGALYAGATDGNLYTIVNGVAVRYGTVSVGIGGSGSGFHGLAYAGSSGFYANIYVANTSPNAFYRISPTATSSTMIGNLPINTASGALAFGPDGTLYDVGFDRLGNMALFSVNTGTGVATEVGSGLGTVNDVGLALVTAGGQLYGIDTSQPYGAGPIRIYTINTASGVATDTGVAVSGLLPGYTLDAATPLAVPEPSSAMTLGFAALAGLVAWARRCRATRHA